jgi:uncharacterized protein (TIGR03083 family)
MESAHAIAALRASHNRLRALLADLPADRLTGRAYPSEWSIAQVASHLGSGAEIGSLTFEAGRAGAEEAPRDANQPIWDTWNAKSPQAQAADAIEADATLVGKFEGLDEAARATIQFPLWWGRGDLLDFAATRLSEHAMHTWDIAVALDPTAKVAADAIPFVLARVPTLVGFAAKPNGREARIHLVTDEGEYHLTLGDPSSFGPWDGGAETARIDLPAEALVRLLYGRLDPGHTPAGITATGISLDDLRATFPGF